MEDDIEAEKLEQWFGDRLPEVLTDGSEFPLLLTAIGEKPGALTMNVDEEQENSLRDFCDEFDLSILVGEGRKSKPDRVLGENPRRDQRCAFVARNEDWFKVLKESEGRFYGFSDRAVGEFLGFTEKAIEFFVENEQPGMKSRKFMEQQEKVPEEVELVTYIVPDDSESIQRAAERGAKHERALRELDDSKNIAIGTQYIESRKNR